MIKALPLPIPLGLKREAKGMMNMVDIATRVWNHKWKIDPIVRSLIDTDFYKLLMCQSVFRNKPDTQVRFSLINRSKHIRLAELVDEGELREQLDHIRSLSLTRGESTWMRGNTFYGKRAMFSPEFMDWFENMQLPPYHLEKKDGQYELTFEGSWPEVMLWEIPALAVLMELRGRAVLGDMGRFELQVLYARAMTKLWEKVTALKGDPSLRIADFGTRRRHSFLWQDWCVQAMREGLGDSFAGTSNCLIAKNRDLEAIGTNAQDPATAAEVAINWWKDRGEDPTQKLVIFSDGLDVDKIIELQTQFSGRCRVSFGWGTMLTNDFKGLTPDDSLAPFSLVCKAISANGKATVKLSDNPNKAMGPAAEIARYKRVFGVGEQEKVDVVV